MILIGQYDSPFVRRVAVTMQLYKLSYEHRPLSAVGDGDRIAEFNPLMRVPTLISSDGMVITDSGTIIQLLDHLAGFGAFLGRNWPQQCEVLSFTAFAAGVAEKAVALVYEKAFHKEALPSWNERLRKQVSETLAMLDRERASRKTPWLFGERLSHADIMIGTMLWPDRATRISDAAMMSMTSPALMPIDSRARMRSVRNVSEASIGGRTPRMASSVSTESKSGSLSSCMSEL